MAGEAAAAPAIAKAGFKQQVEQPCCLKTDLKGKKEGGKKKKNKREKGEKGPLGVAGVASKGCVPTDLTCSGRHVLRARSVRLREHNKLGDLLAAGVSWGR